MHSGVAYQDRLALLLSAHLAECCVRDCIDVGRDLPQRYAAVLLHHMRPIKVGHGGKGVHSNQNRACVGINVILLIADFQVP